MHLQKQFAFFCHSLLLSNCCLAIAVPVLGQEIPNINAGQQQSSWQKTSTRAMEATPEIPSLRELQFGNSSAVYLLRTPRNQNSASQISQATTSVVSVTDVKLNITDKGIELILVTPNSEQLSVSPKTEGNSYIVNIPNAQLQLASGESFQQSKPAAGIALVTVANVDANTLRVTVVGETDAPAVELFDSQTEGLVFGVTSTASTAQQPTPTPEQQPPIELEVIGEAEGSYNVPDASTATKTPTPLRDIPQSIQVVPRQVFEDRVLTKPLETVATVSGVIPSVPSIFGGIGAQAISIRGFNNPNFGTGSNQLRNGLREVVNRENDADLTNIERIEVLKGPASVLYGLGGIGGTINLVTKQPLRDPFYKIDLLVGSHDLYRPSIDFSGPVNDSRTVLYRLNASYQDASSYVDFGKNNQWFIAPVLSWQISPNTKLSLEAQTSRQELRGLVGLPAVGTVLPNPNGKIPRNRYAGEPDDLTTYFDTKIGYDFQHRFSDDWSLRNAFRYTDFKLVNTSAVPNGLASNNRTLRRFYNTPTDDANALSNGFISTTDVVGKFKTGSIQHQILFGVEYFQQSEEVDVRQPNVAPIDIFNPVYGASINTVGTRLKTSFSQNAFGVYLQDQIALANNFKLVLGGRLDAVNQESINRISNVTTELSDVAFSPRAGIVYQPIQPISLYASYSQSFNPVAGTDVNGNSFIPERGAQYEVGIKAQLSSQLATTLAFFDLTRSNVLTTDPNNSTFSIQTGKQSSRGIEFDISGEILPGWNIAAGYAFIDARIDEDKGFAVGNQLNNAPQNSLGLWTSYQIQSGTLKGLGFGLGLFYVGERQVDLANSYSLPSYLRTDTSIFYKRNKFRAIFNVKNLFDVEYFEALSSDRIFYGEPLTLQGTISWEL